MIFAYTLDQVLCSQKSQTRRLIKSGEQLILTEQVLRVVTTGKRVIYQVGKSYAVQPGRGKKSVARILLTNVRREAVEAISDEDATAEGFPSRSAFLETWRAIHGVKSSLCQDVWVLEFKLELIVADELRIFYEQRLAKNGCIDHSDDVPASIAGLSGTPVYSGDHALR